MRSPRRQSGGLAWLGTAAIAALLLSLPATTAHRLRNLVRDASYPGQSAIALLTLRLPALSLGGTTSQDAAADAQNREAQIQAWRTRALAAEADCAAVREERDALRRRPIPNWTPTATTPLVAPRLISARTIGVAGNRLEDWGERLLDRGAREGIRTADLVLDARLPLIDVGSDSGLKRDQPVFAGQVVVGRISQVGRWTCTLQPVTDPGYRGAAQLIRRSPQGAVLGARGVLAGSGDRCRLELIPATDPVSVGDQVFTVPELSALSARMYYGEVVRAELSPGAPHWDVEVAPALGGTLPSTVEILLEQLDPSRFAATVATGDAFEESESRTQ